MCFDAEEGREVREIDWAWVEVKSVEARRAASASLSSGVKEEVRVWSEVMVREVGEDRTADSARDSKRRRRAEGSGSSLEEVVGVVEG